jgi:hypothetical protein
MRFLILASDNLRGDDWSIDEPNRSKGRWRGAKLLASRPKNRAQQCAEVIR